MYKAVLWDMDGTLMDFEAAQYEAIHEVFRKMGIPCRDDDAERFHQINLSLWKQYEQGRITQDVLRQSRFEQLLADRPEASAERFNDAYVMILSTKAPLMPQAIETLAALHGHCRMAALTNGIAQVQHGRIAVAGLGQYFDACIISQEQGFAKPDARIYTAALRALGCPADKALMVGDSLTADIAGAQRIGIRACWYNPRHTKLPEGIQPDYQVGQLRDVVDIVMNCQQPIL